MKAPVITTQYIKPVGIIINLLKFIVVPIVLLYLIFDMGRTTLNIVGDASCAVGVSKIEEKIAAKKAA